MIGNFIMQEWVRSVNIRTFSDPMRDGLIPCTFQIAGICNHDWQTCVWCHLKIQAQGSIGGKCSDLTGAVGCLACHDLIDMRDHRWQQHVEHFEFYKRRATDRSLHMLWQSNILMIQGGGRDKMIEGILEKAVPQIEYQEVKNK